MTDTTSRDCASCPLEGVVLTSQVDGMDRRQFVARGTLALAVAALAACGASDLTAPALTGTVVVNLSEYPALATDGGVAVVTSGGARVALVRTSSTAFTALSLRCPHEGGSINQSGTGFLCSRHKARFSLSGAWQGGERTSSMVPYPTAYDATAATVTIN